MHVKCNTEAHSCKHCCRGKAIGATYSECVFVAFVIRHAIRMLDIVICCLPRSTIYFFPRYLINGRILEKEILNLK